MPKLTKLGKYEIRRELGKGGMGIVYEGFDPYIERTVALKTVQMSMVDKSEVAEVFGRFRREAQAAGRLSHPRIVSIYEYNEDHDMAFIAMELINGKELKDYFDRQHRFSIKESINILLQLLDALDYSHRNGVVHRDIKPANIFLTNDNQVKVADFGIAKVESSHLTQVGSVLGTPSYMSPEQFHGDLVDSRSDLYSAGVILYQLLTGQRPFTGSTITIMHKVLNQAPVPPSELNPAVPAALDEVVLRAMAKRPEQRFQSANEFIAALKLAAKSVGAAADATLDPDATLVVSRQGQDKILRLTPSAATASEKTLVLRPAAKQQPSDLELWKSVKDSQQANDFRTYLQQYPHGEFAELAQLRISALDRAAIDALKAEELRKWEAEKRALREKIAAEARAAEILRQEEMQRQSRRADAHAEAMRRKQAEAQAKRDARMAALKSKMALLKAEAAQVQQQNEARRTQEAEEQARRTQQMAALMAERSKKISEIVAQRAAEAEAQHKLEAETRQKLEGKVKRKLDGRKKTK